MHAKLVTVEEAQQLLGPSRAVRVMLTRADDFRLMNKWMAEQGPPSLNRETRRSAARAIRRRRAHRP